MPIPLHPSEIHHQHKAIFISDAAMMRQDDNLDWAFRKGREPANPETTLIVQEMLTIARDKNTWRDGPYGSALQQEVMNVLREWLNVLGARASIGHRERGF